MYALLQVKEPRTASSPEHLQPDQSHPKPAVRNRDRLIQYAAGGKRIQRKRKYVQIDNRLATLKERLTNGAITPEEFADSASHLLHLG